MSDERHSVRQHGSVEKTPALGFHRNIIALIIHVAQMMSVGN
jgi:hypothetical protein